MIYYIYKITLTKGKLKGHYYIGQHKTDNINDGYKGSGVLVNKYYKKHPNDYIKEIICYCENSDELNEKEAYYVGDLYKTDDMCLNLKAGGNQPGVSDETRQKKSEAMKGKPCYWKGKARKKQSEAMKGKNNPMYGKTHSDETRKKQSEAHKGKPRSDETIQKVSEALKGKTPWNKGKSSGMKGKKGYWHDKTMPDELKQSISEAHKGMHWYNNGIIQTQAFECPVGYVPGMLKHKRKIN